MTYNKYMKNTALSPEAQAVLDAFRPTSHTRKALAAALRAAANQVVPANGSRKNNEIRAELLAIADELDTL
jgi:acetyl-CoA carboxylase carboxyltransferase component